MNEPFDLYEFPEGYIGRKTYVSVKGHSRSIPAIYTYRGTDGRNYLSPDYGGDWSGLANYSTAVQIPMLMRDMSDYVSPIDNSRISSRSQHREHLKRHGVVEVGNEPIGKLRPETPVVDRRANVQAIKRHLEEVKKAPEPLYQERVAEKAREIVRV